MKTRKQKTLPVLLILFCVLLAAAIPAFAMEDVMEDFRGIPWGAPAPVQDGDDSNKWGLVILGSSDSVTLYRRAEQVYVGEVKISAPVEYVFHDELGFACAVIRFNGQEKYDLLHQICIESWGKPSSKQKGKNKEYGGNTISNLWIDRKIFKILNYNVNIPDEGTLSFVTSDYVQTKTKINIKMLMK